MRKAKSGKRRLQNGAPRMLGHHGGHEGRVYFRAFAALAESFPLSTPLLKLEAGRVAALRVQLERANADLVDAQRKRREGKGRRPSVQQIERLSRRAGLADGSYSQALRFLQDLVIRSSSRGARLDLARKVQAVTP